MEPVLNQDQTALKTQNRAKSPALKSKPTMTRHVHAINRKHKTQNALNRFALSRISLALISVLGAEPALATTITWVGNGDWSTASGWDLNRVPTFEDTVSLDRLLGITVGTNAEAKNIIGSGSLLISGGSSLSLVDTSSSSNLNQLTLGGTLTNNGLLIVSGNTETIGGTLAGTGSTILNGDLTFRGGMNSTRLLDSQTLTLKGTTTNNALTINTTRSVNYLQIGQGARLVNQGTWLDNTTNSTIISGNTLTNTGGVFENQGAYTKSQTSTTDIGGHGLTFNNSGTVNVNAGTLRMTADGTSTGIFNIASGSELDFNAGAYLFNTANVNNAGVFKVSGATVTATQGLNLGGTTVISGGALQLEADSSMSDLNMFSGSKLNNYAFLSVSGSSNLISATIAGAGITALNGTTQLSSSNSKLMNDQTLITNGLFTLNKFVNINAPTLIVSTGAKLENQGIFNIKNEYSGSLIQGDENTNSGGVFNNYGEINKLRPDVFRTVTNDEIGKYGLVFNNLGVLNVNFGRLAILGGGTSTGHINIGSGATLEFSTTAYNLGRNVSNAGILSVSNGGVVNADDGLTLGGVTVLNNGTLNIGATSTIADIRVGSSSVLNINTGVLSTAFPTSILGTINISHGAELNDTNSAFFRNSGVITGNGTIRTISTLNNSGSLAAGGLNSIGQLSIMGNLAQTSAGQINIDLGRTAADLLAISGTATLGGALNINVTEGLSRGSSYKVISWADRTANSEFDSISFSQAANYRLGTTYDVDGLTVNMKGFNFYWSGPENGGLWNVDQHWSGGNGGRPQAGDAAFLGNANTRLNNIQEIAEIVGSGTLTLAGYSDLRLSERANLGGLVLEHQSNFKNDGYAVVNGNSQWLGGLLTGTGTTCFDGDLVMAGSTRGLRGGHTLELNGTSTYADSNGVMYVSEGARIINNGQWITQSNGVSHGIGNGFGGANGTFDNIGTFTMASPDPKSQFSISSIIFNNSGNLNVNSGMLDMQTLNSTTGQINIASLGTLRLSSGTANLKGTINNAGTLRIEGRGVFNPIDHLIVQGGQTILNDSTINNTHSLRITGNFDWKQGTITGTGTTRLEGNTTLSESTHAVINGHTIEFVGNTAHTGGVIYTGQGSRLINLGTWTEQNTGFNSLSNGYGGASSTFDNVGTFNKSSNAMFDIGGGVTFNNTGTLNVNASTLRFSDKVNSTTGQINIASGAVLSFNGGNANLKDTINNAGTLSVEGRGVFNPVDGLIIQGGQTILNDSTINNAHSLRIAGAFEWKQGMLTGAGITRLEGNTTLSESTHAVTNGHTIEFAGDTHHTGGIIYTGQGSRLVNLGTWQDQNTGNIDISNGFGGSSSSFDNQGTFIKTGSAMTTFGGDLDLSNTGNIQINAGTLRLLNSFNNKGQMNVAAGAELSGNTPVFGSAGTVTGDGTIRASSNFTNTGTLAAGGLDDAGHLSLIGNFTQGSSGNFLVDLGGVDAGTFDLFSISGNALLGGTLAVNMLDGVQFNLGDSFTVMTWNQRLSNSQFANLDFTQANGYQFSAEYNDNNLTLRIVAVPVQEPTSAALLWLGLLGLTGYRLTRKTAAA